MYCHSQFMKAYVRPNLSHATEVRVESLFRALSGLFELFLFVYIGLSLFLVGTVFNIFGYTVRHNCASLSVMNVWQINILYSRTQKSSICSRCMIVYSALSGCHNIRVQGGFFCFTHFALT